MKAIFQDRYGSHDVLALRHIDRPAPGPGEILVRVHAASVHAGDILVMRGEPRFMRPFVFGWGRPKNPVRGHDLAGVVEAVGEGVTRFEPGDEVLGEREGSLAEYVCGPQDHFTLKPAGLSFEQAAALPVSGLAALHAVRDTAKVQAGQKVLIIGASGGVGTYAVQLAKHHGAEVTAVCSTRNVELVRSLGADHVVDYTKEDFTRTDERYDLVFDNIENRTLAECRSVLAADGMLLLNSGTGASGLSMLWRLLKPVVLDPFVGHKLRRYFSAPNAEDLATLAELAGSGAIRPVIDQVFPLDEAIDAVAVVESGHARGKVVVAVR